MTMPEAKSIEEQLIKISLRTLAAILIGVIVGGGSVVTPVFFNGTNWIAQ